MSPKPEELVERIAATLRYQAPYLALTDSLNCARAVIAELDLKNPATHLTMYEMGRELTQSRARVTELEAELRGVRSDHSSLRVSADIVRRERDVLDDRVKNRDTLIASMGTELSEARESLRACAKEGVRRADESYRAGKAELEATVQSLRGELEACERQLQEQHNRADRNFRDVNRLAAELSAVREELVKPDARTLYVHRTVTTPGSTPAADGPVDGARCVRCGAANRLRAGVCGVCKIREATEAQLEKCPMCGGSGKVPGDCLDSPNYWEDPCPKCAEQPEAKSRGYVTREGTAEGPEHPANTMAREALEREGYRVKPEAKPLHGSDGKFNVVEAVCGPVSLPGGLGAYETRFARLEAWAESLWAEDASGEHKPFPEAIGKAAASLPTSAEDKAVVDALRMIPQPTCTPMLRDGEARVARLEADFTRLKQRFDRLVTGHADISVVDSPKVYK